MITRTSLANSGYLLRIKAAILLAIRKANKPGMPHGIGHVEVYNRNGALSVEVRGWRGGNFEVFGGPEMDTNLTDVVVGALVDYHAKPRVQAVAPSRVPIWPSTYEGYDLRPSYGHSAA